MLFCFRFNKATFKMADEIDVSSNADLKRKRSRHWDHEETKKLITKWSEDNIQERLKSCTRFECIF